MGLPHRSDGLWFAHMIHRVSGLLLAVFLPAHFLVLGLALEGAAAMEPFIAWTANPIVKFAEVTLVALLALHLFGGLRILALEFLPWSPRQKTWAALATALSFFVGIGFLLSATTA